jgi:hypothetical protein
MSRNTVVTKAPGFFLHPIWKGLAFGILVLAFLVISYQLSIYYGLKESQRVLDDICGGAIAGLLLYRQERARLKYLAEKLKTIEMMNHHVRNALQVIVDAAYLHGHAEQLEQIGDSVKRIDWALREILPGQVVEQYHAPASLQHKGSGRPAA